MGTDLDQCRYPCRPTSPQCRPARSLCVLASSSFAKASAGRVAREPIRTVRADCAARRNRPRSITITSTSTSTGMSEADSVESDTDDDHKTGVAQYKRLPHFDDLRGHETFVFFVLFVAIPPSVRARSSRMNYPCPSVSSVVPFPRRSLGRSGSAIHAGPLSLRLRARGS